MISDLSCGQQAVQNVVLPQPVRRRRTRRSASCCGAHVAGVEQDAAAMRAMAASIDSEETGYEV